MEAVSDEDRYAGFLRVLGQPPPPPEALPALAPGWIGRALDEMWNEGPRLQLPCDDGCACCEPGTGGART